MPEYNIGDEIEMREFVHPAVDAVAGKKGVILSYNDPFYFVEFDIGPVKVHKFDFK